MSRDESKLLISQWLFKKVGMHLVNFPKSFFSFSLINCTSVVQRDEFVKTFA